MIFSDLSPEARKIVELLGGEGAAIGEKSDMASVIGAHPELLPGLNEYMRWRDDQMRAIEKQETVPPVAHGVSETLKKLGEKKK